MIFVDTAETWTLLNRRCGHRVAASAAAIRHSKLGRVERIPAALEEEAWQWRGKPAGFVELRPVTVHTITIRKTPT